MDMAAAGANAADILAHYFPGTEIAVIDSGGRRLLPVARRVPYNRASAYEKHMRSLQTLGGPTAMLKSNTDGLLPAR
jgi:hypothetical protein